MVRDMGGTYALTYGPPYSTTTTQEYGGDSWQGHEAGDNRASWAVEEGIPI